MLRLEIGVVVAAVLALGSPAPAQYGGATVDEVIAALPPAGEERQRDAEGVLREHPASKEMLQRIVRRELSDAQWVEAIERTGVFETHEKWPRGRELAVSLRAPMWLGPRGLVRVTPRLVDAKAAEVLTMGFRCGLAMDYERERRAYIEVGPVDPEAREIEWSVEVFRGARLDWSGEITRPIEMVGSESEAMEAVHDDAFDRAVEQAVYVSIGRNQGDPARTALWVKVQRTPELEPFLDLHALRARVQILDQEEVIDEFAMSTEPTAPMPCYHSYYCPKISEDILEDPARVARLRVRVSGTAEGAFGNLRRESYWAGSFERPIGEMEPGRERAGAGGETGERP